MTQTTRFVCAKCKDSGMFFTTFPTEKSGNAHIGRTPVCKAAGMGLRTIVLETRPTDTMVGGSGAAGIVPDLRHQPPGLHAVKKNRRRAKIGIFQVYLKQIAITKVYTLYILEIWDIYMLY